MTRKLLLAGLTLCLVASGSVIATAAPGDVNGRYYFTGQPNDEANKASNPTAKFGKQAPTSGAPITQTASPTCNSDIPGHANCIFWQGNYSGPIVGNMEFCWYWSSTNPEATALGLELEVTVFADPEMSGEAETQNIIGRSTINLATPTPQSQKYVSHVYVQGGVQEKMLIQVAAVFSDTGPGNSVYYGSPDAPSTFGPVGAACPEEGGGGTPLESPKPTLGFNDSTPERGTIVRARAGLKTCNKQTKGTNIKLQKKIDGTFKTIRTKELGDTCKATFRVRAKFKKAVFRSFWPKQSPKYKAGKSRERTVTTHA